MEAGHATVPLAEVANPSQGNEQHVDPGTGGITLNVLAGILGSVEVIAIGNWRPPGCMTVSEPGVTGTPALPWQNL